MGVNYAHLIHERILTMGQPEKHDGLPRSMKSTRSAANKAVKNVAGKKPAKEMTKKAGKKFAAKKTAKKAVTKRAPGMASAKSPARSGRSARRPALKSTAGHFPRRSHEEALSAVRSGILPEEIRAIVDRGYRQGDVVRIIGPRSTIERKLSQNIQLDRQESDRLARLSRVIANAEQVFGGPEKARQWMERPSPQLPEGESPLSLLDTDGGAQMVTERLLQIEHGMFA